MWYMQSGERVFTSAEWRCLAGPLELFLDRLLDDITHDDDDTDTGVEVFDRLTLEQKLLLLTETCEALCMPEIPSPEHKAVNEGAIAAVFELLRVDILVEAEMATGTLNRRALLEAMADDPVEDSPTENSTNHDEWNLLVDCFADRVLWDADYELSDFHLDLPPTKGELMDDVMQVDDSYFGAVPGDVHPTQVEAVVERLRKLIRSAGQ